MKLQCFNLKKYHVTFAEINEMHSLNDILKLYQPFGDLVYLKSYYFLQS